MSAQMKVTDSTGTATPQTDSFGIFRLPKPDVNGFCNDYYGATFMENAANKCTRQFSLSQDCTTVLNPLNWVTNVILQGGQAPGSQ
jgi:hypothetical protein